MRFAPHCHTRIAENDDDEDLDALLGVPASDFDKNRSTITKKPRFYQPFSTLAPSTVQALASRPPIACLLSTRADRDEAFAALTAIEPRHTGEAL
jgi:hypothetical protein